MAHTFSHLLTHVIFSTQDRQPFLTPDLVPDLLAYMGGIVRNLIHLGVGSVAPPELRDSVLPLFPRLKRRGLVSGGPSGLNM
ncbi:MAG: hypothetical protein ACRD2B_15190 [Terriglobia bacterium]